MNPSNYRLSKEVLQAMLDDDYQKKVHQFETVYDNQVKGLSPSDMAQKFMDEFLIKHSEPLKKMQIDYLQGS